MANYVDSYISFDSDVSSEFKRKVVEEGLLETVVPIPDEIINIYPHYSILDLYRKFVSNSYSVEGIKLPNDKVEFFWQLSEDKEMYGFSDNRDYEDFVGTSGVCYENWYNNDLKFESKWTPLSMDFLKILAKDYPSFTYHYQGGEMWGGEISFYKGELDYETEWSSPDMEICDVNIEGVEVEFYRLIAWDKDGYKAGYYKDDYFDFFLGETLEEAIENYKKDGF